MSLKLKGRRVFLSKSYGYIHGVITKDLIFLKVLVDGQDHPMTVEVKDIHFDYKKKGRGK